MSSWLSHLPLNEYVHACFIFDNGKATVCLSGEKVWSGGE